MSIREKMENIIESRSFNYMELHIIVAEVGSEFVLTLTKDEVFLGEDYIDISGRSIEDMKLRYNDDIIYDEESDTYECGTGNFGFWVMFY